MYRPKPIPPIRLNQLESVPTYEQLHVFYEQVRSAAGRRLELPIIVDDGRRAFLLVSILPKDGDPEFQLYSGLGNKAPLLWTHATCDMHFLLNLVLNDITGASIEDTLSKGRSTEIAGMRLGFNPALFGHTDAPVGWGTSSVPVPVDERNAATLEGDLKNIPAASILQSVLISKLNGLLVVADGSEEIKIYFVDGMPTHGHSIETVGDKSVIELLTWDMGRFKFLPNERSTEKTVNKRLEVLLMEGVTLLDQRTYLNQQGLTMESYLIRKEQALSEQEFEKKVSTGAPISGDTQKQFYRLVDSQSTLFEMLRGWPMAKSEWIPILFNLLSCDVVVLSDRPAMSSQKSRFSAVAIDRASIDGALKIMLRPDTGIMSYPMMAYFLDYEFQRFETGGPPFALVLFDMMMVDQYGTMLQPSPPVVAEVSRRIGLVKRKIDFFGHWETLGYALILPQTDSAASSLVVSRMAEVIRDGTIVGGINKNNLAIALGVGNLPEDANHLGVLLAGVKEAKERAKRGTSPIVLMRSLES